MEILPEIMVLPETAAHQEAMVPPEAAVRQETAALPETAVRQETALPAKEVPPAGTMIPVGVIRLLPAIRSRLLRTQRARLLGKPEENRTSVLLSFAR